MNDNLYIPRRLNDPPKLLIFDLDSAMVFLTCMFLGMLGTQTLSGIGIGIVLSYLFTKLKTGKHPAFALHYFYWHLPGKLLKKMPESSLREYIG